MIHGECARIEESQRLRYGAGVRRGNFFYLRLNNFCGGVVVPKFSFRLGYVLPGPRRAPR